MVPSAERDSELVTYLATERAGLRESKMVGVRGRAAADETRLLGDIAKVLPVAIAPRSRDCEDALIDAHLIGAGFIHLANLVTTSVATFRRVHVHDLSAFGRQELGEPFFKRFLQDLCIFCSEPVLGSKSSPCPLGRTFTRSQPSDLAQ
jgi:hypothetical protein